ncbi:Deoxycytidine triphosphate deaminase [Brevinematales bacterium NS]|nr:dCTP deaminase [Brevinematales bacterium]QJR21803.1 Deoxycytidine triphosphate deaminase [Brevinematales bacterium NS]
MIITASEIRKAIKRGDIIIDPYDEKFLNPNSYNLRLHNELYVLREGCLDMKMACAYDVLTIPPEGLVLEPNRLYLGRTVEHTTSKKYVPLIEGRSSIGRLGIFIHATAGFGDVGFSGYWTLEISVIQPIRVYPFVEIAQIYFHTVKGKIEPYKGKYQNNKGIQISGIYKEFE